MWQGASALALALLVSPAEAVTTVGVTSTIGESSAVNNTFESAGSPTHSTEGSWLDGSVNALQSDFNNGIVNDNPANGVGSFALGNIPVFQNIFESQFPGGESDLLIGGYFEFFYDAQQNQNANIIIDTLTITFNGDTIWDLDQVFSGPMETDAQIDLDPGSPGNNADLSLYIPVQVFSNYALANNVNGTGRFVGTDVVGFQYTVLGDNGGNEEWGVRRCTDTEVTGNPNFLGCFNGDTICELPIPGSMPLLLVGIAGLVYAAKRRQA